MGFLRRLFGKQSQPETRPDPPDQPNLPPAVREVLAELARSGVVINSQEDLNSALAARPDLQARLSAALGGGPTIPPQFQADLQQAQTGEQRYVQRGDRRGLDEAAAAWERIFQHPTFTDAPSRFQLAAYNNGGGVFLRRYWAQGQIADLNRALQLWQTAMQRTPPDSPDLPRNLNNLGNGLSDRYARTGQLADLEEAIRVYQTAVQRTPPDSPDLPGSLNNLGTGLSARYARTGQLADLEEAIRVYEQACLLGQERQPEAVVVAARSWGQWALARQTWDEAVRAYQYGLTALEQLYQTQLLQHEQQSWQREGQGLYARTAYALARVGDLFAAAIALEQGQARGLNDRLARDEANLLQVQQQSPALFQQYQAAAARLRQLEAAERQERQPGPGAATPPDWAAQSGWATHRQQVQQARTDLQAAITAIRQLDGYKHFLLPPRFEEVATAVHPGHPLAYLVTTPAGSLALLLQRPAPTAEVLIEPLWADAFTEDALNVFLVKRENDQVQGGYLLGQFFGGTLLSATLVDGLPHLGETLLAPLADGLNARQRAVEFDEGRAGVAAAALAPAVNGHGAGDGGQGAGWLDGLLAAGCADSEGDTVCAGVGVGVEDGLAQGTGAAVGGGGDGVGGGVGNGRYPP